MPCIWHHGHLFNFVLTQQTVNRLGPVFDVGFDGIFQIGSLSDLIKT
jgi:hypothetical protein